MAVCIHCMWRAKTCIHSVYIDYSAIWQHGTSGSDGYKQCTVRCSDMLRVNKRSVLNVTVYLPVEWGIPACFSSLVMVCLVTNQIIGMRYFHQRLVVVCKVVKVPSWWPLTTLGGHQEGTLMCRVFSVLILLLLCNTAFMHVEKSHTATGYFMCITVTVLVVKAEKPTENL